MLAPWLMTMPPTSAPLVTWAQMPLTGLPLTSPVIGAPEVVVTVTPPVPLLKESMPSPPEMLMALVSVIANWAVPPPSTKMPVPTGTVIVPVAFTVATPAPSV